MTPHQPSPRNLVIFDCDGTLVDSQHNITAAMAHAFAAHDLAAPARTDVLGVVGLSLPEAFRELASGQTADVQASLARQYKDAFATGALRHRAEEPLYPGIATAIAALTARADVVLGVATGKSKRGVQRLFDREGWHGQFITIQTADDNPSKPHPAMILKAMAETGIGPAATVMIGDTAFDMEMARNAAVGAIGVGWGYHPVERLQAAGAHTIITDGMRLLAAIEQRLGEQERSR